MHKFEEELKVVLLDIKHAADVNPTECINDWIYKLSEGKINLFQETPQNSIYLKFELDYTSMKIFSKCLIKYHFKNLFRGLSDIETLLLSKNKLYGNSILEPRKTFSKDVNIESVILSRMDEKLNRIINNDDSDSEDAWLDLIGYSIFYLINKKFYI